MFGASDSISLLGHLVFISTSAVYCLILRLVLSHLTPFKLVNTYQCQQTIHVLVAIIRRSCNIQWSCYCKSALLLEITNGSPASDFSLSNCVTTLSDARNSAVSSSRIAGRHNVQ